MHEAYRLPVTQLTSLQVTAHFVSERLILLGFEVFPKHIRY
jgi:hypothetical protein